MARNIEPHCGDLADPESLERGAKDADAVIHTAQVQIGPDTDIAEASGVMSAALTVLLDTLEGTGKTLTTTSGTGAYGDTGTAVVDETSPLAVSPMMVSFAQDEARVLEASTRGVRSPIVRSAIVYGRGGGPLLGMMDLAKGAGAGIYVGAGDNLTSTVHVEDVADLYVRAL